MLFLLLSEVIIFGKKFEEVFAEMINNSRVVREQYNTADNLNTRISIHEKYSVNKQGFNNWIFSNYDISPNMEILELGCGTGELWKSKLPLSINGVKIILTDFSEGMVSAVRENFKDCANVSYDTVNIENIPYEDGRFDRVVANMMLYHVPDIDRGLSEVKQVMADDGYFYCATYGENGIIPYIAGLLKEYGVTDNANCNFTLQNGESILRKYFSYVKRLDYEDALAVTDIDDILDYIYSMSGILSVARLDRSTVKEVLEKNMENGVLKIPKEYGMFICAK